jgi:hypothetical protein
LSRERDPAAREKLKIKPMADKKKNRPLAILIGAGFVGVFLLASVFLIFQYVGYAGQSPQPAPSGQSDQTGLIPGWNSYRNDQMGFSFQYPNNFFDAGHEPQVLVGSCNANGFPNACPDVSGLLGQDAPMYANQQGSLASINNATYCKFQASDAATGHVYTYYAYATVKNQLCLTVSFAISTANCDFYLPLEQGNIQQETNYNNCVETNKNQPQVLSQMIGTFKLDQ